jgi:hypothetical protein
MTKKPISKIFLREEEKFMPMRHGMDLDASNSQHGEQQKHIQHSQYHH